MPNFSAKTGRGRSNRTVEMSEVVSYGHAIEHRMDHQARYKLHDLDEGIWRLEKYTLEELKTYGAQTDAKLWPAYTDNGPRTHWNAVRSSVTANPPEFHISLPTLTDTPIEEFEELMKESSRHERFASGVWRSIDEQRVRSGTLPFQDQFGFYLSIRGGAFMRPWFNPDARFPFSCPLWDPKTLAYERGEDSLDFVSHHYWAPKYIVLNRDYKTNLTQKELANIGTDENGNVEVWDCWWCEYDDKEVPHIWNAVSAGGVDLRKPREYRDLDHVPVYLIPAFGPEVEPNADYHYTTQRALDAWESIYTTNRDTYPWVNRIGTLYGIYLRNNAIGPWFAKQTGMNAEQLRNAIRPFNVIQSENPNAEFGPVTPPAMAAEVKEFFTYLQGSEQRGSVPYSAFGQIPFQLSGFAVNQLQGAVAMTSAQISKMMGFGYQLATDQFIQQFKERGGQVTIRGMDKRSRGYIDEISAAELRAKYNLEVKVTPKLPVDRLQEAQVAVAWSQAGIDPVTIGEEVLHIPDMREVAKRMLAYQQIVQELAMQAQAMAAQQQARPGGPPPQLLPPEAQGDTTMHNQFQPSAQQTSTENLEAAGFTR